jgi:hypothetical protein
MTSITTNSSVEQIHESETVRRLTEHSFNRAAAHYGHQDSVVDHRATRAKHLSQDIARLEDVPIATLLKELRGAGLLWSSVAQIVGVTDTAVRKWRKGSAIDAVHKRRVARLVALMDHFVAFSADSRPQGFASWLHTPVVDEFSCTPVQLLALSREKSISAIQPLIDNMLGVEGERPEGVLDYYLGSTWRDEAHAEAKFAIEKNAEGDRILVVLD